MKLAHREPINTDAPSVRMLDGRFVFNVGTAKWKHLWDTVYKFKVVHWKDTLCTHINVESLMEAAFPSCVGNDLLRVSLAHDYIWKVIEVRERHALQKAQARKELKNGGDT